MTIGIKIMICIIALLLTIIMKRGTPAKIMRYDIIAFVIIFIIYLIIIGVLDMGIFTKLV